MKYNLKPDERATLEIRGLYEKYGYKKYKIGKFEEYSLYAANRDFILGDKVLSFTDLDGRLLAMKPDVTLSVINNTSATRERTEKLYYIENVYRENKESHCFKEINQMGLEYLGNIDEYSILEVLILAAESLRIIDSDYLLELSNMHYTVHLLEALDLSEGYYIELLNNIRQKNATGISLTAENAGLDKAMIDLLCEIPFLYGEPSKTIERAEKMAISEAMTRDVEELEKLYRALKASGYGKNIQIDLSMVNDIDYYNGIVFRGYIRKLPGCVLSGGQYDKAMKLLSKNAGAVGFAIYLDELNKGKHIPVKYDVDALLVYDGNDDVTQIIKAVNALQKEGMSVRADINEPAGLRFRDKYVIKDGQPVKEEV